MNYITRDYIDETIGSFDFTKMSVVNMNRIVDSREFKDMDSEAIFDYLHRSMEMVSFSDYLKRYLNRRAELQNAQDSVYVQILKDSFLANHAPRTLSIRKISFSKLLQSQTVSRNTVFLLGFGLKMTDTDVSEFLTKVILEHDFDMENRTEAIYWYCFHHGYEYRKALELLNYQGNSTGIDLKNADMSQLAQEDIFLDYISGLQEDGHSEDSRKVYEELYQRAEEAASKVTGERSYNSVETVLCSGIPRKESGNLFEIKKSALAKHFRKQRMTRQRISQIVKGKKDPERFDVITLLFLVYGIEVEPDWPAERFLKYVDEVSDLLGKCHMMGIYPVNPYESYILMCLLSEEPITVYSDIWEMSYE